MWGTEWRSRAGFVCRVPVTPGPRWTWSPAWRKLGWGGDVREGGFNDRGGGRKRAGWGGVRRSLCACLAILWGWVSCCWGGMGGSDVHDRSSCADEEDAGVFASTLRRVDLDLFGVWESI